MKHLSTAAVIAFSFSTASQAAVISADTATASSEFSGGYVAENTINGTGLSTAGDPTATHADYVFGNHWTTRANDVLGASISWGFSGGASVGGIYIWNHLSNIIASNPGYEPTLFDLDLLDGSDNVIASFDDIDLSPDTNMAQAFSFGEIFADVSTITFTVEEVQGTTPFTGLAEVLFDDSFQIQGATDIGAVSPIPLPAGLPLLAGAFGLLFGLRRRIR